jgi:hypothetical protein
VVAARTLARVPTRFRTVWLVTFGLVVAIGTLWNLAQPLFSGADELEHVKRAEGVIRGQWVPPLKSAPSQLMAAEVKVAVPPDTAGCYIGRSEVPASCDPAPYEDWPEGRAPTYVGRAPVPGYLLNGAGVAVEPGRRGLYASRLLTTATGALFLATSVALAATRRRPFLLLGVLLAATPSVVAGLGVLSTSPLEIGSASLAWVMVALLADGERPTAPVVALLVGALSVLALSRPISFIWAGLACVALLVLKRPEGVRDVFRRRGGRIALAVLGSAFAGSLAWFVFASAGPDPACIPKCQGAFWEFMRARRSMFEASIGARLSTVLAEITGYWRQAMGAVGFNEYVSPWWVQLGWTVLLAGALAVAGLVADRRRLLVVGGLLAVLFGFPIVVQTYYLPRTGVFWQGRYDLPVLAGIAILAASVLDARGAAIPGVRRLLAVGIPTVAVLHLLAFLGSLRRYAVGVNGSMNPLHWGSGWRPPLPALVLAVLMTVVLAVACAWFAALAARTEPVSPAPTPS